MPEMLTDDTSRGAGGAPTEQNWVTAEKPAAVPAVAVAPAMNVLIGGRPYMPADGLDDAAFLQKKLKKKKKKKKMKARCGVLTLLIVIVIVITCATGRHHKGHHGDDDEDSGSAHHVDMSRGLGWRGARGHGHGPLHGCVVKGEPEVDPSDLMYALEDEAHNQELQEIEVEVGQGESEADSAKISVQGKTGGRRPSRGGRKTREEICAAMTEKGAPEKKHENESQAVTDARLKVWGLKKAVACAAADADLTQPLANLRAAYAELRAARGSSN